MEASRNKNLEAKRASRLSGASVIVDECIFAWFASACARNVQS
jgi:hypothetical protein